MMVVTQLCLGITLVVEYCFAAAVEKQYECGAHGKFEYCIDGIPGCIVGCHCHPGYYFDTESKICEPNTKLTHDFRRQYVSDNRIYSPVLPPENTAFTNPTPTPHVTSMLDKKVDDIANNADDIGDWLYNQFFKTIESQVINNTEAEKRPTRRSGGGMASNKPKRKNRKSIRKDGKKKKGKGKNHGLRRKLLRITEDDSLFDSSSGSTDSSSDSSSSTDSDSDTSDSRGRKDKEHGHKKIIMFKKRGKPPLPSFIFLPHLTAGSAFYPPIGLPPPPVLPMYPMAPIPPMAPMIQFPAYTPKESEKKTEAAASTTTTTTTTTPKTAKDSNGDPPKPNDPKDNPPNPHNVPDETIEENPKDPKDNPPNPPNVPDEKIDEKPKDPNEKPGTRMRLKKRRGKKLENDKQNLGLAFRTRGNKKRHNRLMQKLREQMMNNYQIPEDEQHFLNDAPDETFPDDGPDEFPLLSELPATQESNPYFQKMLIPPITKELPKNREVDFTYLSDLIHRANFNGTKNKPPYTLEGTENINQTIKSAQIGRRTYNSKAYPYAELLHKFERPKQSNPVPTDFYANLGRQIATMIRNVDKNGDRQINVEIEHTNFPTTPETMIFENRFGPQSYWERSIRSPLKYFKDDYNYMKASNEKLFSLEEEVETVVNTTPAMNLQELENVLSTITKVEFRFNDLNSADSAGKNNSNLSRLNINLLPKSEKSRSDLQRFSGNVVPMLPGISPTNGVNISQKFLQPHINAHINDYWLIDNIHSGPIRSTERNIIDQSQSESPPNAAYNLKPTRKPSVFFPPLGKHTASNLTANLPRKVEYLKFLKVPQRKFPTTSKIPFMSYNPQIVNLKSANYLLNSKSRYFYGQKHVVPHPVPNVRLSRKYSESRSGPSYFHHAVHHFDYFE